MQRALLEGLTQAGGKSHGITRYQRQSAEVDLEIAGCLEALAQAEDAVDETALIEDRAALVARREALVALIAHIERRELDGAVAVAEAAHAVAVPAHEKAKRGSGTRQTWCGRRRPASGS